MQVRRDSFVDIATNIWIADLLSTTSLSALNLVANNTIEALLEVRRADRYLGIDSFTLDQGMNLSWNILDLLLNGAASAVGCN